MSILVESLQLSGFGHEILQVLDIDLLEASPRRFHAALGHLSLEGLAQRRLNVLPLSLTFSLYPCPESLLNSLGTLKDILELGIEFDLLCWLYRFLVVLLDLLLMLFVLLLQFLFVFPEVIFFGV